MTRIAFTADIHADDLGKGIDPETGLDRRFLDTLRVLGWIAVDARERGCSALVVAGDFTERRHAEPWRVAMIGDELAKFQGPTILLRGNHDGIKGGQSIVDVLSLMLRDSHGFSHPGLARVDTTIIATLPHLDARWLRTQPGMGSVPDADINRILGEQFVAIARGLYAQAQGWADVEHVVLVVHQALAGGLMSDTQQAFLGDRSLVIDTGALAAIGFDAVVAGHFHLHQVLHRSPLVAYAGSPYRTDFGEQDQAKGYMVLDTADPDAFEFVETPARRMVTLRGPGLHTAEPVRDAIVRGIDLSRDLDLAQLRRTLETSEGAFEVQELRHAPAEATVATGGMSEALSAHEALECYFAEDPDRDAVVQRGRGVLAEVGS